MRRVTSDFESWFDLLKADFPAYGAPPDEPAADHRTDDERDHDRARALMDLIGEQDCLFPLRDFEPVTIVVPDMLTDERKWTPGPRFSGSTCGFTPPVAD